MHNTTLAYFISDLHLQDSDPEGIARFEAFVQQQAVQAQALYILGDLFEAWIGDDLPGMAGERVAQALQQLRAQGVRVYFMPGNRDFLVGPAVAAKAGWTVLPDPTVITLAGTRVVLTHGDILCADDQAYQRYRGIVQHPAFKRCFLALPSGWRNRIAAHLRQQSSHQTPQKPAAYLDVSETAVQALLQQNAAAAIIHGHTHRPQAGPTRFVLGAWDSPTPRVLRITAESSDFWMLDPPIPQPQSS